MTNQFARMSLLDSRLFVGGAIILSMSTLLFAGFAFAASNCPPHADVSSTFCSDYSLVWFPLVGIPFGVVMVAYPLLRSRRAFTVLSRWAVLTSRTIRLMRLPSEA